MIGQPANTHEIGEDLSAVGPAGTPAPAQPGRPAAGTSDPSRGTETPEPALSTLQADEVTRYEPVVARLLAEGDAGPLTLAVTSSVSGEGVSTVCTGLGIALARSTTKRVLLVDANLRRPALHERFGVPISPGLCDLITGTDNLLASRTTIPNLWLIPSGMSTQYPAQLMTSEAAKTRIRGLQARFDYVVIDCPPVLTAVDASSVCRLAGGVIIVLRSGLTPREDVDRTRDVLRDAPLMGVILNGV